MYMYLEELVGYELKMDFVCHGCIQRMNLALLLDSPDPYGSKKDPKIQLSTESRETKNITFRQQ